MSISIEQITAKTGDLPPMPEVAMKVLKLLRNPNTTARTLQDTISADQGMTLQILKIANSALYGLKREVKTLSHAIMILGFNSIRSIVLASATKNLHSGKSMGLKEKLLWEKSIGCAFISRIIASKNSDFDKEEAFIGGLMHNMGQTVFNTRFPDEYDSIIQQHYMEGIPVEMLEKQKFGFSHNELGSAITAKWNLSENITQIILYYLTPAMAPGEFQTLTALINLAHNLCLDLGVGVREPQPLNPTFLRSPLEILGIDMERFEHWKKSLVNMLEENPGALTEI